MPISVVCPGCQKRFSVSEKFAGQEGPCPKCKAKIKIPEVADDEIVVHAPEDAGPKDSKGRAVSKPILREETKFSPKIAVGIGIGVVVVVVLAIILRGNAPPVILALGALALAPPLVLGGYAFLRNDELEAYSGKELWIRVLACSAAYAFLWGVYVWFPWALGLPEGLFALRHILFALPPLVMAGGFAAFASLDLDYSMALIHYGFYVLVTAALCFVMGIQLFAPAT